MRFKKQQFSNFSRNMKVESRGLRPDNEEQLKDCFKPEAEYGFLARGRGLSYNDSCLNSQGYTIESQRLNHFESFDSKTGQVLCQGSVSFSDLFLDILTLYRLSYQAPYMPAWLEALPMMCMGKITPLLAVLAIKSNGLVCKPVMNCDTAAGKKIPICFMPQLAA